MYGDNYLSLLIYSEKFVTMETPQTSTTPGKSIETYQTLKICI